MKHTFLWLTLKLMRKQKLRTLTLSASILFSTFLLCAFGSFGYEFWMQIHEGSTASGEFDSTQFILISLIAVLLLLVLSCSAILLYNLFSLTALQKWNSVNRLFMLGATKQNILFMLIVELGILYSFAAPPGYLFAHILGIWIGVKYPAPIWMTGGIFLWILLLTAICGIRPILQVMQNSKPIFDSVLKQLKIHPETSHSNSRRSKRKFKSQKNNTSFTTFMSHKYFLANRGHYLKIMLTILAAILLYVPVSYLINTNLKVHHSELEKKYGITYNCAPDNYNELLQCLQELQHLSGIDTTKCFESMIYVSLYGTTSIKSEWLSDDLITVLKKAGWEGERNLEADTTIYFLEDSHYLKYLYANPAISSDLAQTSPAILVNKYVNNTSWNQNENAMYAQTPLLNQNAILSDIAVYYNFDYNELELDKTQYIVPQIVFNEPPEDFDFTGNVSIILPLSHLDAFSTTIKDFWNVYVCGFFEDTNEEIFTQLEQNLPENPLGVLCYTRKTYQEWYDSMQGIHMAMISICATLFFIALLNVFCTMIFHYIARKRGLAILWSLGQSELDLLKILILENTRSFFLAALLGIPASSILCYYIYTIYRSVWYIDFTLPWEQLILILTAALISSAIALFINWCLMRKQNYLQDIRDIS